MSKKLQINYKKYIYIYKLFYIYIYMLITIYICSFFVIPLRILFMLILRSTVAILAGTFADTGLSFDIVDNQAARV